MDKRVSQQEIEGDNMQRKQWFVIAGIFFLVSCYFQYLTGMWISSQAEQVKISSEAIIRHLESGGNLEDVPEMYGETYTYAGIKATIYISFSLIGSAIFFATLICGVLEKSH